MTICSLGDLVLDVIVRLDQPLAPGADATARDRAPPGGQAANVAAWVAALGGRHASSASAAPTMPGDLAARDSRARRRARGPVVPRATASSSRSSTRRRADDGSDRGVAPELSRRRARPGVVRRLRRLHISGLRALREAVDGAALAAAGLRARGSAGERRPLLLDAIRDFGAERFRELLERLGPGRGLRQRGRGCIVGGPRGSHGVVKRGARGASFAATSAWAVPVERRRCDGRRRCLGRRLSRGRSRARARGRRALRRQRGLDARPRDRG